MTTINRKKTSPNTSQRQNPATTFFQVTEGEFRFILDCPNLPAADILCDLDGSGKSHKSQPSSVSSRCSSSSAPSQEELIAIPPLMQDCFSLSPLVDKNYKSYLQQERDYHPQLRVVGDRPRLAGLPLHSVTSRALDAVSLLCAVGATVRYTPLDTTLPNFVNTTLPKMSKGEIVPLIDICFPAQLIMDPCSSPSAAAANNNSMVAQPLDVRQTVSTLLAAAAAATPTTTEQQMQQLTLIPIQQKDIKFDHLCPPWHNPGINPQAAAATAASGGYLPNDRHAHLANVNFGQQCPFLDVPVAVRSSVIHQTATPQCTVGDDSTPCCPFFISYGYCTINNCPYAHICYDNKLKTWVVLPAALNAAFSKVMCTDLVRGDRESTFKKQRLFWHSYQQKLVEVERIRAPIPTAPMLPAQLPAANNTGVSTINATQQPPPQFQQHPQVGIMPQQQQQQPQQAVSGLQPFQQLPLPQDGGMVFMQQQQVRQMQLLQQQALLQQQLLNLQQQIVMDPTVGTGFGAPLQQQQQQQQQQFPSPVFPQQQQQQQQQAIVVPQQPQHQFINTVPQQQPTLIPSHSISAPAGIPANVTQQQSFDTPLVNYPGSTGSVSQQLLWGANNSGASLAAQGHNSTSSITVGAIGDVAPLPLKSNNSFTTSGSRESHHPSSSEFDGLSSGVTSQNSSYNSKRRNRRNSIASSTGVGMSTSIVPTTQSL